MRVTDIRDMMHDAVADQNLVDPETGQPFIVSMSYVDGFLQARTATLAAALAAAPPRLALARALARACAPLLALTAALGAAAFAAALHFL